MKTFFIILFIFLQQYTLFSEDIQKIVVIGKKDSHTAENTTYSLTVITEDEIKKSGARNITDLLGKTIGINFYRYGPGSSFSKLSIRGSSNEQILVLINGERINNSSGGGVDFSTININRIKRIEIIREGISAVYGDGAFSGVINIITKKNLQSKHSIGIAYSYGSFNTHSVDFYIETGYKEFLKYFIGGNLLLSDGGYLFKDQRRGTIKKRLNTGITSGQIDTRLLFDYKYDKIVLGFRYYQDTRGVPGSIEFPSYTASMEDKFAFINGLYSKNFGKAIIKFSSGYQNMYRRFTDEKFFLGAIDDINNSNIYFGSIGLTYNFILLFQHNITSEYNYRNEKLFSTALEKGEGTIYDGDVKKISHSLKFSDDIQMIKNKLLLKAAIRYDIFNLYNNKPSYYLGSNIRFDKHKKLILKLSIGTSYRTPSFEDLFLPDTGFAVGNSDLKPEESLNYNIGTIFKLYDWLKTEINIFRKNSINLIQWNPGAGGKWRPKNIKKVVTTGVELEGKSLFFIRLISSYLELTYNYTLLYVTDKSGEASTDGKQLPLRPFETANFIFSLTKNKKFSIQFESHFVGFRYLTAHNTKYLNSYLVHNINTIYNYRNLKFSILIKNITEEKYIDIRGFPIPGMEIYFKIGIRL